MVSIHAPRAGRDLRLGQSAEDGTLFQSTRPVRGATGEKTRVRIGIFVSIHAPRAGRDLVCLTSVMAQGCFNPRAPCGARPPFLVWMTFCILFQSTRPVRGATVPCTGLRPPYHSFNPRAPCGARLIAFAISRLSFWFQSTRPVRGATLDIVLRALRLRVSIHAPRAGRDYGTLRFSEPRSSFNPRAPCGARRGVAGRPFRDGGVSIHAPRAGRDYDNRSEDCCHRVSIHAPRAGRDSPYARVFVLSNVSIHAPRAGRDNYTQTSSVPTIVSIHAPRAGRDGSLFAFDSFLMCFNPRAPCGARRLAGKDPFRVFVFQSTRPVRGATFEAGYFDTPKTVSIHAPRAGRDGTVAPYVAELICFNPRAPCGARPSKYVSSRSIPMFQSTRPVRGATERNPCAGATTRVSIHAPRAGRDTAAVYRSITSKCFNPRAPCGARLDVAARLGHTNAFQSTRPVRGATVRVGNCDAVLRVSIHAPRAGRDDGSAYMRSAEPCFNPRAPCGARQPYRLP